MFSLNNTQGLVSETTQNPIIELGGKNENAFKKRNKQNSINHLHDDARRSMRDFVWTEATERTRCMLTSV